MTVSISKSDYSICVAPTDAGWVASVPELGVQEIASTPYDAMSAAIAAELEVRKKLAADGVGLPPTADRLDPLPGVTRFVRRHFPFVAKVAVGYTLVLGLTAAALIVVFPSARARAEQYVGSNAAAADA